MLQKVILWKVLWFVTDRYAVIAIEMILGSVLMDMQCSRRAGI